MRVGGVSRYPRPPSPNKLCTDLNRPMVPPLVVLLLLLFCSSYPATTTPPSAMSMQLAKPGCRDKCGNITVPYPFGLGGPFPIEDDPRCYRPGFQLFCNETSTPPTLYHVQPRSGRHASIYSDYIEVAEISLEGQVHAYLVMNYICHNDSSVSSVNATDFNRDLTDTPYTYSDTGNMFVAAGCDAKAYFMHMNDETTGWYGALQYGCMVGCDDKAETLSGNFTGMGYCHTPIPKGVKFISMNLDLRRNDSWDTWDFNTCKYSFIAHKQWYNFSVADLLGFDFYKRNRVKFMHVGITATATSPPTAWDISANV